MHSELEHGYRLPVLWADLSSLRAPSATAPEGRQTPSTSQNLNFENLSPLFFVITISHPFPLVLSIPFHPLFTLLIDVWLSVHTALSSETMDFGYPQILSIDVLRTYINLGTIRSLDGDPQETGQLTSQITGAIDWRREGIRHRKNEVRSAVPLFFCGLPLAAPLF